MYWLKEILQQLSNYVLLLLQRGAIPEAGWNAVRRRFVVQLVVALVLSGDVMFSAIVRHLPRGKAAIRHRYKNADRLLGEVDVVTIAAEQTAELGRHVGPGAVIAVDLSDIAKPYAKAMPNLHTVHDGSTDQLVPGYGLATAVAFDLTGERKAVPLPLMFEVFSSKEEDHKSQPAIWLDMLRRICASTKHGTIVIDREGDNGRIFRLLLQERRDFVVRLQTHENSRHVLIHEKSRARVMDAWKEATFYGEMSAERMSADGSRKPYRCTFGSLPVRLPGYDHTLWMCVFDSLDHLQPLVVLTTHRADTAEAVQQVLARYFARWAVEELHRFAKQEFKLENIRALTWKRLQNLVAATWIVLGAIALFAKRPAAEQALRVFEVLSQRIIKPLHEGQFWGYTFTQGIRMAIPDARRVLAFVWAFWEPVPPDQQQSLFGAAA